MPKDNPFQLPDDFEPLNLRWDFVRNKPRQEKKESIVEKFSFSLQEKVLLKALIAFLDNQASHDDALNIVIGYDLDTRKVSRVHSVSEVTNDKIQDIAEQYKDKPIELTSFLRQALARISKDKNISSIVEKNDRVQRYLKASLTLQVKLDRMSFLASETVHKGVPDYVPDGLSDMGSNPNTDPSQRSREKIRVNKSEIFTRYSAQLTELLIVISKSHLDSNDTQIKGYIIEAISKMVYDALPYDQKLRAGIQGAFLGRSLDVNDIHDKDLALCRHHALETQVLLQAMGIQSQLFKCKVRFGTGQMGGHAANLVELDNYWYILDTTNPEEIDGI